ncbi:MAG: hypothetical protein ISR77_28975 [Pirellulaceae bacterium]|nr:hypothetical protein [Pirellulaceae bacterium]
MILTRVAIAGFAVGCFGYCGTAVGQIAVTLARYESVQKELQLDDRQMEAIESAVAKADAQIGEVRKQFGLDLSFAELRKLPSEVRQERVDKSRPVLEKLRYGLEEQNEEELASILRPKQLERLRQITLQSYVNNIHLQPLHPALARQLMVTDGQKMRWSAMRSELSEGFRRTRTSEDRLAFGQEIVAAKAEMMKMFTPAQTQKLKELQGKKFDFTQLLPPKARLQSKSPSRVVQRAVALVK